MLYVMLKYASYSPSAFALQTNPPRCGSNDYDNQLTMKIIIYVYMTEEKRCSLLLINLT